MKINQERLWRHLQELGEIGREADGGITRFPFTKQDAAAQRLIARYMEEAGLQVHTDAAGNLIGTWPSCGRQAIVSGSHFDTVRGGGMFDGCLGVLGAIEAVQTLKENGFRPQQTIRVIGFKDEEGNRFGYGMIGSKAINAAVRAEGLASCDEAGVSLREAMQKAGWRPAELADCEMRDVRAMVELHIEQGRVLEQNGCDIGVVTGIAGLVRYTLCIEGVSAHAGATPMKERCDPVVAMSEWIMAISEKAASRPYCVATIGQIQTVPGVCNVICERVQFSLDLRGMEDETLDAVMEEMQEVENRLRQKHGVTFQRRLEQRLSAAPCDLSLRQAITSICAEQGLISQPIMSGAGHDCMNFYGRCPIAMIFVPSKEGRSHCKEEYTAPSQCVAGAQVLMELLRQLAE